MVDPEFDCSVPRRLGGQSKVQPAISYGNMFSHRLNRSHKLRVSISVPLYCRHEARA
jgi:hypothetical protein